MIKQTVGFTLIELLVVITIIALLGGIAYPSYRSYILKSRRGEAQIKLFKAQLKQSNLHILNPAYSDDESLLGLINDDYYNFSVASATTTSYLIKAVAKATQERDSECLILTINQNNHKTPENCW